MATAANKPRGKAGIPPPQHNLRTATEKAVEELRRQSCEQMTWLGAARRDDLRLLRVLDDTLRVDTSRGHVSTSDGRDVRPEWRIVVLHYLAISARCQARRPEVTFADLPQGRAYAGVYHARVVKRLCATAGVDYESLSAAAARLGARRVDGGDLAFEMDVFPRLPVQVIWYAGDDELDPSATVLLPSNVQEMFCSEDIVAMSELLVARLGGGTF